MQARKISAAIATTLALCGSAARADLTIEFDYSLDVNHFFTADKRQVLNQVASIFGHNLGNHLAAIDNLSFTGPDMAYFDYATGQWTAYAGSAASMSHQNIAADTLRIFVGATDLKGSAVGLAWVGTAYPARSGAAFGFGSGWGGEILFDTTMDLSGLTSIDGSHPYAGQTMARNWYVDSDIRDLEAFGATKLYVDPANPSGPYWSLQQLDFASVAMHEMGHMFGLPHSYDTADSMFPSIGGGERKFFDGNDWSAMQAHGWQVKSFNPDLTQVVSVPEPASYALLAAGLGCVGWAARRRRPQA